MTQPAAPTQTTTLNPQRTTSTENRPGATTLANRIGRRLSATTIVAALALAAFTTTATTDAHAAPTQTQQANKQTEQTSKRRHTAFEAPTSVAPTDVECRKTDPNTWKIAVTWKVTGGRYANLGDPTKAPKRGDNVWRGGRRFVTNTETWHGYPGNPNDPVTTDFSYQQQVAPIDKVNNIRTWRTVSDRPTITFTC